MAAPLLILNSSELVIVDIAKFNVCQFSALAKSKLDLSEALNENTRIGGLNNHSLGFWNSIHTINFALPLFLTLKKMGAQGIELIEAGEIGKNNKLDHLSFSEQPIKATIGFKWKHPTDSIASYRKLTIWSQTTIEEAIRRVDLLPNRIRSYFEKAAVLEASQQGLLENQDFYRRLEADNSFAVISHRYQHAPAQFQRYVEQTETLYSRACATDIVKSKFGCKNGYGWKMRILKPAWHPNDFRSVRAPNRIVS